MKTSIDISHQVMDRVVRFEKNRAGLWFMRFITVLIVLIALQFGFSLLTIEDLKQKGTFDLLQLFTQDWEIIGDYWQDTLVVIVGELPINLIIVLSVALCIFLFIIVKTGHKRRVMQRRLQESVKYRTNRKSLPAQAGKP